MSNPEERMRVLERLEKGEINPDEAARLLETDQPLPEPARRPIDILEQVERGELDADQAAALLSQGRPQPRPKAQTVLRQAANQSLPDFEAARRWWVLPMAAGILVMALSAGWMQSIIASRGVGLLFLCAWLPLALGLLLIIVAWAAQSGTWLHVRLRSERPGSPHRIVFSMPLPLRLASWFMRSFGVYIKGLDARDVDAILSALENSGRAGEPFYIKVDDDQAGDYIEVYIA